jgi:hypothetical protein
MLKMRKTLTEMNNYDGNDNGGDSKGMRHNSSYLLFTLEIPIRLYIIRVDTKEMQKSGGTIK